MKIKRITMLRTVRVLCILWAVGMFFDYIYEAYCHHQLTATLSIASCAIMIYGIFGLGEMIDREREG